MYKSALTQFEFSDVTRPSSETSINLFCFALMSIRIGFARASMNKYIYECFQFICSVPYRIYRAFSWNSIIVMINVDPTLQQCEFTSRVSMLTGPNFQKFKLCVSEQLEWSKKNRFERKLNQRFWMTSESTLKSLRFLCYRRWATFPTFTSLHSNIITRLLILDYEH